MRVSLAFSLIETLLSILILFGITVVMIAIFSKPPADQLKEETDKIISFLRFERAESALSGVNVKVSFVDEKTIKSEKRNEETLSWEDNQTITIGGPPEIALVKIEPFDPIYIYPDGSTSSGTINLALEEKRCSVIISEFGEIK